MRASVRAREEGRDNENNAGEGRGGAEDGQRGPNPRASSSATDLVVVGCDGNEGVNLLGVQDVFVLGQGKSAFHGAINAAFVQQPLC